MVSVAVGKLEPFSSEKAISVYLEQVEMYLKANSVASNKHVPVFLTMIGAVTTQYFGTCWPPRNSQSSP